jgi:hypothetical protein
LLPFNDDSVAWQRPGSADFRGSWLTLPAHQTLVQAPPSRADDLDAEGSAPGWQIRQTEEHRGVIGGWYKEYRSPGHRNDELAANSVTMWCVGMMEKTITCVSKTTI